MARRFAYMIATLFVVAFGVLAGAPAACLGTLALLAVAALTSHQPGYLGRAAIGAGTLACFYLALAWETPSSPPASA